MLKNQPLKGTKKVTYYNNCNDVSDEQRDLLMRNLYDQGMEERDLYLIRSSRLFSGTTLEELILMMGCLSPFVKKYDEGDFIFRTGERIENMAIVLEGTVKIEKEDFWGNRRIIDTLGTSGTFGDTYACAPVSVTEVSVSAVSDVRVIFFNVNRILTMCSMSCDHHSRIIRNLIGQLAESSLSLTRKLSHVIQKTTRAKLMGYLSDISQANGSLSFDIPLSRQELADYLGVDRSGLSVEIGKLCDEGIIDANKNHFTLKV